MAAQVEHSEFTVGGVRVESAIPRNANSETPIVFVHGGGQGSWAWRNYLTHFAERGRRAMRSTGTTTTAHGRCPKRNSSTEASRTSRKKSGSSPRI
jgi:pimeloyl-ACP methyl ester carboxylesterase